METQGMTGRRIAEVELLADACPVCGGDGFLIADDDAELQCEACEGTGVKAAKQRAA